MTVEIRPADDALLRELESWRYPSPYDFYDGAADPVLNPERYYGGYAEDGALVGFFYYEQRDDVVEIGLGLRPELTGKGLGLGFLQAGLDFARDQFHPRLIVLNVAAFNERAISIYERAGFRRSGSHVRTFARWGDVPFVEMEEGR